MPPAMRKNAGRLVNGAGSRKVHHKGTKGTKEEGFEPQINADDFFAPKAQESLSAFISVHLRFHFLLRALRAFVVNLPSGPGCVWERDCFMMGAWRRRRSSPFSARIAPG
jgi:hypothetical protein